MMKHRWSRSVASLVLFGVFPVSSALGLSACGDDEAQTSTIPVDQFGRPLDPSGNSAGNGGGGSGSTGEFGSGGFGPSGGNQTPITQEEICQTMTAEAEPVAVDMYVILDQSVSMAETTASGGTRWDAVTAAIGSFVNDARSNGIGVGIDYFGIGADPEANCDAANYADPDVGIGELPGNRDALLTSLSDALGPQTATLTPTYAALDGALQYAAAHAADLAAADSNRLTMVLLATDGFPTQCEQSLPAISALAEAAYTADSSVITNVIALTEGEANARAIAEQGGGKSFIIRADEDVAQRFLDAMLSITLSNIPCDYEIDRGVTDAGATVEINSTRAQVNFESAATGARTLPRRDNSVDCAASGGDGFYFDREVDPTRVILCEDTCAQIGAGTLTINLTCVEDDPGTTF
jgi:hypothetical protein